MRTRNEERQLIDQILAGRTDLFEVLVEPTTPLLKPCAIRLLRSRADADEVVQEALWKAFARLGQFRGDASFRTWLFRILVNLVLMLLNLLPILPLDGGRILASLLPRRAAWQFAKLEPWGLPLLLLLFFVPVYGSNVLSIILSPLLFESEALVRAMVLL